jgi:hypothetical protein
MESTNLRNYIMIRILQKARLGKCGIKFGREKTALKNTHFAFHSRLYFIYKMFSIPRNCKMFIKNWKADDSFKEIMHQKIMMKCCTCFSNVSHDIGGCTSKIIKQDTEIVLRYVLYIYMSSWSIHNVQFLSK